jgi:D-glycero-D-manno-heptose 1,7-bisphosphate phosphatase
VSAPKLDTASLRHVILDRDGVLNVEAQPGSFVTRPEDFHWVPGALEGLQILQRAGLRLSVATNQSGIGRGLMTLENLRAIHARMESEAAAAGITLAHLLVCPHAPEVQCDCRKPAPGLIYEAIRRSGIPASQSLLVGDDGRDLEAARRAGVPAVLVRTGKGRHTEQHLERSVAAYDDLVLLARALTHSHATVS